MSKITVGRSKENEITFEETSISKKHLAITVKSYGDYFIEDLESTNGTYVNGNRILKSNLKKSDKLTLGDFVVSMKEFSNELDQIYISRKTDFTKEYKRLLRTFEQYQGRKEAILKPAILPIVIRLGSGLLVILIILLFPNLIPGENKIVIMMGVGLLSVAANFIGPSQIKKTEMLDLLKLEFEDKLVCPKCKHKMISNNITYWRGKKECVNARCDAIYQ